MTAPKNLNVRLLALFSVLFVVAVGFGIVIPILPLIARNYGASAFMLGMMTAGYSIVQFLFSPWWGQISDRIGRKPVLMIGITGLSISFLYMGFAHSFTGLFVGRVLGGFLGSATLPAAQALAAELSGGSNRAKAMGLMGAAFGTGFIFGPLLGGALAPFGMSIPFLAGGVLSLATILLSALVLQEPSPEEKARAGARTSESTTFFQNMHAALTGPGNPYYLLAFAIMFAQSSLMTALAFFLTDRFGAGPSAIGAVFALNGAFGALIQGAAIGPITNRLGEAKTILIGLGFGVGGFLLLVLAPTMGLAIPCVALTAVSMSLTRPAATSLLSKVTTLPQGITMGLQGSFDSLGRVVGPLWAGFAYDHAGALPFVSAALVYSAMWMYLRSRSPVARPAEEASATEALAPSDGRPIERERALELERPATSRTK